VIIRPRTTKTGFLGCLMREIFACNRVVTAKNGPTSPYFTQQTGDLTWGIKFETTKHATGGPAMVNVRIYWVIT
jgi:hypothetical protein